MGLLVPQEGPQRAFLATNADIAIYGGAAGGGKTWALLLEPLKWLHVPGFNAVYFRRNLQQVKNPGGLWDESYRIYPGLLSPGRPNQQDFTWTWGGKAGAYIKMDGLQYETTITEFQGAQIPLLMYDELTHFTERQFFYMLSRNRSTCGVRPYIRATTNPDGGSWVKRLLAPWVDKRFPNPARFGEVRYLARIGDKLEWVSADWRDAAGIGPKSITYIPASVYDNQELLKKDPGYISNLLTLNYVDRMRLLYGDWDVMPEAGKVFNRNRIQICPFPHGMGPEIVRFWDFAATEKQLRKPDPDYTVGVKMMRSGNRFYILDVIAIQADPATVDQLVMDTARADGRNVAIRWEVEGGSSGKMVAHYLTGKLAGYDARGVRPYGDKVARSRALAAQVEAGNIWLVESGWNEPYLAELYHFPNWAHDDQVDATAGAFNYLTTEAGTWDDKAFGALAS